MLTDKQKRFCEEYVVDLNATQAAIRAGYSEKTANEQGSQNLAKLSVQEYIKELQQQLSEKTGITAERVLQELADIGFHNIKDFINGGNSVLELKTIDKRKTAAVASIKTTIRGSVEGPETTTEIKLHNKIAALELIGKHIGLFEKDNTQKKGDVAVHIFKLPDNGRDDSATAAGLPAKGTE
jgi:phage terminase small subunit